MSVSINAASEGELKRWLADFRIESSLILPPAIPELKISLPDCEVSIQNSSEKDLPTEALAAQLLVSARSLKEADGIAHARLREILDTLSFGTSSVFRFSRCRFVMDWTPGLETRTYMPTDTMRPQIDGPSSVQIILIRLRCWKPPTV
jgi:hypothetical protein